MLVTKIQKVRQCRSTHQNTMHISPHTYIHKYSRSISKQSKDSRVPGTHPTPTGGGGGRVTSGGGGGQQDCTIPKALIIV